MTYQCAVDVTPLVAIDMHVHIEVDEKGHPALPPQLDEAASRYFGATERPGIGAIADLYRELRMAAVVFTVDARTNLGHPPIDSAEIARGAERHNDVLIPFGSVDPTTGADALDLAGRLVEDSGVRGFKFHPTVQGFDPSDQRWYPLWGLLQSFGLPAVFHTGQTGIGAGLPGGYGLRLGLSNPILLDSVAGDFPDWQIIMAHPSVPWQDEALAVATHKSNVWIDLSGWSPKYFPEALVRAARSRLQDRVLFGSDFPMLRPDRWVGDAESLGFDAAVTAKIMKTNAARLLGLAGSEEETA